MTAHTLSAALKTRRAEVFLPECQAHTAAQPSDGLLGSLWSGGVFAMEDDPYSLGRWASLSLGTTPVGDCGRPWVSGSVRSQHCLLQLHAASSVVLSEVSQVPPLGSTAVGGVGWVGKGLFLSLWPCSPSNNGGCPTSAAISLPCH